jgi:hypothetical protein
MLRIGIAIVLVTVSGCETATDTKVGLAITEPSLTATILDNIPTNSDKRLHFWPFNP